MSRLRNILTLSLTAAALGLAACANPTTIEDHFEVDGIAIQGATIEDYQYMLDDATVPTLELTEGVHEVVFVLLDHDGQPISEAGHDEEHEEHELQVTIDDTAVLTWTEEAHAEEHATVQFHGELNALQEGLTEMHVCVPHGVDHCDFEADVPVRVLGSAQ